MKISMSSNIKREQLAAKSVPTPRPIQVDEPLRLTNPRVDLESNKAVMADLKKFSAIDPAQIRAEAAARLSDAVQSVNDQIERSMRFINIRFSTHEASGRTYAVLRDRDTGEMLRMIPSEAFLEIAARLREASGLFVDVRG